MKTKSCWPGKGANRFNQSKPRLLNSFNTSPTNLDLGQDQTLPATARRAFSSRSGKQMVQAQSAVRRLPQSEGCRDRKPGGRPAVGSGGCGIWESDVQPFCDLRQSGSNHQRRHLKRFRLSHNEPITKSGLTSLHFISQTWVALRSSTGWFRTANG